MVHASTATNDWVLDFFAGSGTTGAVARKLGRRFVLVDENEEGLRIMAKRLGTDGIDFLSDGGSSVIDGLEATTERLF